MDFVDHLKVINLAVKRKSAHAIGLSVGVLQNIDSRFFEGRNEVQTIVHSR